MKRNREATRPELVTLVADESEYSEDTVEEILEAVDRMGGRVTGITVTIEDDE